MSSAIAKASAVGLYSMHQPTGSLRSDKPGGPALTNINGVSAGAPINGGPASASFAAASNQYYALAQGLSDAFLLPTTNGRWWMTFGYFRRATTQGDRTIDSIDAQFITSVTIPAESFVSDLFIHRSIEGAEAAFLGNPEGVLDRCTCLIMEGHPTSHGGRDLGLEEVLSMPLGLPGWRQVDRYGAVAAYLREAPAAR